MKKIIVLNFKRVLTNSLKSLNFYKVNLWKNEIKFGYFVMSQ